VINVRGMHLTGVSRNTINVGIATTVSSFSALMMLSTGTVMFPKDVIKSPGKDKEISADHERRNWISTAGSGPKPLAYPAR
jgi:hypothetical protein